MRGIKPTDTAYISWLILGFLAVYVPVSFSLFPPFVSPHNGVRFSAQLAWLAPMVPLWRWNRGLRWNRGYFLSGFLTAVGFFVVLGLVIHLFANYSGPWIRSTSASALFTAFSWCFTSALFALRAASVRGALVIGILCLIGQLAVGFVLFVWLFPPIVR